MSPPASVNEIAFALKSGVPVVGLGTWKLSKDDREVADPIVRANTPEEAVDLALGFARGPRHS